MNRTRAFASLALTAALTLALAAAAFAQSRTPDPLAPPATTIADTVPPPPGAPNLAWLSSLELRGEVADSLRMAFLSAFRGAFAEGAYATERTHGGRPAPSLPASARFRLIEGTSGWGVWNLQVVAEPLPKDDPRAPGFHVTIAALSPDAVDAGARPIPVETTFALDAAELPAPGGSVRVVPLVPWHRMAGRATALLALERLHHLAGDLDDDTVMALGPVTRVAVPAPADPGAKPAKKRKAERY